MANWLRHGTTGGGSLNLSKGTIPSVNPVPLLFTIPTVFQHDNRRNHQDRGARLCRSMAALDQVENTGISSVQECNVNIVAGETITFRETGRK
jgi:hypothetical protein